MSCVRMSQGAVPAYPTPFTLHTPPPPPLFPTHSPGRYVFIEHVAAEPSSRLATVQSWVAPAVRALAGGCDVTRRTVDTIREAGVCARAWVRRRHRPAQAALLAAATAAAACMPAPHCGQLLLVGSHTPVPHPHPMRGMSTPVRGWGEIEWGMGGWVGGTRGGSTPVRGWSDPLFGG